jgi:hypothetical protein
MEITKEQIRSIVITRIPFAIINSKGKMKYPFISSNASEQVVNALVNGIYEELSKLHQSTVSNRRELLIAYELKLWINPTQEQIEIAEQIVDMYLRN